MSYLNPTLHVIHRIRAGTQHANEVPQGPGGRRIARIWTIMDEDLLRQIGLVHNRSAFLEDHIHDWRLDGNGKLHFYSRVVEIGREVDVVLDYETIAERRAREQAEAKQFDPMTGQALG